MSNSSFGNIIKVISNDNNGTPTPVSVGPGLTIDRAGKINLTLGTSMQTINDLLETKPVVMSPDNQQNDVDISSYIKTADADSKFAPQSTVQDLMITTQDVVQQVAVVTHRAYAKAESDERYYLKQDVDDNFALKTDIPQIPDLSNFATKTDISGFLTTGDFDSTIAAYVTSEDIDDYYTKEQSDDRYLQKVDAASIYATKTDLSNAANDQNTAITNALTNYPTLNSVNSALSNYALTSYLDNFYTKTAVDQQLSSLNLSQYTTKSDLVPLALKTDIPSLANYALKSDIPSLNGYAHTSDLANLINSTQLTNALSGYALKSDIPVLTSYALKSDLNPYALKTDIPSLTAYALKSDLTPYALKTDLTPYALKTDLSSFVTSAQVDTQIATALVPYATTNQVSNMLSNYVTSSALTNTLSNYATTASLSGYATVGSLTNYATTASLANYVTGATLTTTLGSYYTKTQSDSKYALKTDLSAYQTVAGMSSYYTKSEVDATVTGLNSSITALNAGLAKKVIVFDGTGTQVSAPKQFIATKAITVAGSIVFYLTNNGAANGTAIFTALNNVQVTVNDATATYPSSWVVSADQKTLTITVNKAGSTTPALLSIAILTAPAPAAIGTTVSILVSGY